LSLGGGNAPLPPAGLASFCPPLNFRIGRHCQPDRMDVIQQAAGKHWHVVAQAYSLAELQNAGRAHARLCHAFSIVFVLFYLHLFI